MAALLFIGSLKTRWCMNHVNNRPILALAELMWCERLGERKC
jgi:hypothetical protein